MAQDPLSRSKPHICIIAFKDVRSTIHVLRQIYHLAPDHELTVIGHGVPDPTWPALHWSAIPTATLTSKIARAVCYLFGRLSPSAYDFWYWHSLRFIKAYEAALRSGADAIHANDWQALPVAVEVARRTHARIVFHQHEYAELEREDNFFWRWLVSPALRFLLTKYTSDPEVRLEASITVCKPIAERYRRELGIDPIVVYNAPIPVRSAGAPHETSPDSIRLIHHGYAQSGRGIDQMIRALAQTDRRFTLDLMLMDDDPAHVRYLKRLADEVAPGRIFFRPPVPPLDIVLTVAEYDIGLCVIQPITYNTLMMLPNKLFEYIQAGLAVCVGPSPAMVDIVQRYGVGCCAPGFQPHDIASTLDSMSAVDIRAMRSAARRAGATLNADVEMEKITAIYRRMWDPQPLAASLN